LGLIVAVVGALIALAYWLAAPAYVPIVPLISFPLFLGAVIDPFGWLLRDSFDLLPSGALIANPVRFNDSSALLSE